MVVFEDVSKVYEDGTVAADKLNLNIAEGELAVFIGPSGCGKTTSLKLINRLEDPTSGKIYVGGQDVTQLNPVKLRRATGYVIQEIGLFPHMTVAENIGIVPRLHKWGRKKTEMRVDQLMEMAGLTPVEQYKYRLPEQLSGGQQQRIGVLRALAVEPKVILMDEPFGALDPISRENLQNELVDLQRQLKKTIVFVTHDIDEALKIADKIVFMRQGKIVQTGSPAEIQGTPADDFVRSFIGHERLSAIGADSPVNVIVEAAPLVFGPGDKLQFMLESLENTGHGSAQVIDKHNRWLGMVTTQALKKALSSGLNLEEILNRERKLFADNATLKDAAEMLSDVELSVPVLGNDRSLQGVVTHRGIAMLTISRLQRQPTCKKEGETR